MTKETKPKQGDWEPPAHLIPYAPCTHYGDRAAELFNSNATPFNNTPLFIMHAETQAQWILLDRLHQAGHLRPARLRTRLAVLAGLLRRRNTRGTA